MKGSIIASQIVNEMKRAEVFRKKAVRQQCIVDKKKQCNICGYKDICDNVEDK